MRLKKIMIKTMYVLALPVVLLITSSFRPHPELRDLNVVLIRGNEAKSVLAYPRYVQTFKNIFSGHTLEILEEPKKEKFLRSMFENDVVYLSIHANAYKLKVRKDVIVTSDDIAAENKTAKPDANGHNLPGLVIVSGCETLAESKNSKQSFPEAFGIVPTSKKRAYIGFKTITVGMLCDRYFRVFLALWTKPTAGGQYPTLSQARIAAQEFIRKKLDIQIKLDKGVTNAGGKEELIESEDPNQFGAKDALVGDWLTIIGDQDLRITDL
jgi:hypothetical protein